MEIAKFLKKCSASETRQLHSKAVFTVPLFNEFIYRTTNNGKNPIQYKNYLLA